MTSPQVAKKYGITRQRVKQIAAARGIVGPKIGNTTVFTLDQVKQLKPAPTGRPKKK